MLPVGSTPPRQTCSASSTISSGPGGTSLSTAITMTHRSPLDGLPLAWQRHPGEPSTLWHNGATGGYRAFVAIRPSTLTSVVILLSSFTIRGADLVGLSLLRQLD